MKYCEVFLRSGDSIRTGAMEDSEADRLVGCFKEQFPGVQEFKDDKGIFYCRCLT